MSLKIVYYGNPLLRKRAIPISTITEPIKQLAREMGSWVRERRGLGLSAPQVGSSIRLFVTCFPLILPDGKLEQGPETLVFINPKIALPSKECWTRPEACFSLPGIQADVTRPVRITVEALDLDGKRFELELEGLPARIVMHENDHINGVLMIDRMPSRDRKRIDSDLKQMAKKYST